RRTARAMVNPLLFPFIPADAGIQSLPNNRLSLPAMDSRFRGNERKGIPSCSSAETLLQALRGRGIEFVDERNRLRPFAESGCRIEVTDLAEVDQLAAPRSRERGGALV